MSSAQGSSSISQSGGSSSSDGLFRKHREPSITPKLHRSLPDVCPKEPTGSAGAVSDAPSVVCEPQRWSVYNSKVNLPAALNDPRLAKRESDFFTKTWGLEFSEGSILPCFHLPNISREEFSAYLQETAQREKIHERCKNICPNKDDLSLPCITNNYEKARAELEQVPKIFMKPDFALNDPVTFNTVLPWSHFSVAGGNSRDVASSRLLQEKLSHYLDVVEVSIARQISLRSDAFFHAMSSQHQLQDRLSETADSVSRLRARTAGIHRVLCRAPLRVLRDVRSRNNCVALQAKLQLMAALQQTQPTVQLLLAGGEFTGALELISTSKEVLQQELQGIHSFRHLGSQLCEMERLIDKMMVADFSSYAQSDLSRPLEEDAQVLEKERLQSLVFGLLRQRKLDFLDLYSEEMMRAARNVVRQCVVRGLSENSEVDADTVKIHEQMRLMAFDQWLDLLLEIFQHFLLFLRRIKSTLSVIRNVALEVLDNRQSRQLTANMTSTNHPESAANQDEEEEDEEESSGPIPHRGEAELAYLTHEGLFISDALNEAEQRSTSASTARKQLHNDTCGSDSASATTESEDVMPSDLELGRVANNAQELLYSASDICHDRCVKVLLIRAKDGSLERLSSSEFVCVSQAVESFLGDCESLCGRRSVSLRGALQSQAQRFLQRFHEERKNKLSLLLDNERWKQAEVPAEFQDLVDSIADGRISLPERKLSSGSEDRKPGEFLCVDGQTYAVVGTVLLLIRMFLEYCQCVNDIPSITTDILTRLADLLKLFNSRCCQLVLGAGALQLVGLKTITTRNLALASRCLQLVLYFLPVIRVFFESRLQPKQYSVLRHFDHITKDYNDHIAEIAAKLVVIMDGMFEKALSKYEVKAPMPSACLRNVCKQMLKMHEAIYELLPEEQTQMLFLRINASFKLHLKRQLCRLGVINDGGPQYGLVMVDVCFYSENVQALRSLERLDLNMPEIWEQKR
ncbi:hypothetical protein DNTS_030167 [Danionella cerebrum]|uniref:Vacuolar protein sorting-associated protein 54 n=1 Tax=Danionella cerebrum TaxID=2873325 RepID=A0A553Q809_9TELE|nr:hypothetical protein DNTS_030167 [Danionella translucida]